LLKNPSNPTRIGVGRERVGKEIARQGWKEG